MRSTRPFPGPLAALLILAGTVVAAIAHGVRAVDNDWPEPLPPNAPLEELKRYAGCECRACSGLDN